MEFSKDMAGSMVYAIPTGNNRARGNVEQQVVEFEVVKVKRRYVELKRDGWSRTNNYCKESGGTQESITSGYYNAGYVFFPSLEAIAKHTLSLKKKKEIIHPVRYHMYYSKPESNCKSISDVRCQMSDV